MWKSLTDGWVTYDEMIKAIVEFASCPPDIECELIVGTDSQVHRHSTIVYDTAVIIRRVGKGARFFVHGRQQNVPVSLQQRILTEVSLSLEVAEMLRESLEGSDLFGRIEIHVDAGHNGATREIVSQAVGMIRGSGYDAKIKPDSYAASAVADRSTKRMMDREPITRGA